MNKVQATIITIGDELLIGQVIDTNSAFIAQELNKIGIQVLQRIAIADDEQAIFKTLNNAFNDSEIILLTGGLGPTADDITKPTLCKYFGGEMIVHQPTLDFVQYLFENVFKKPMIERNTKQAEVPSSCQVIMNEKGTAPAMLFEKNNKICIAMPGVPFEMKWIIREKVIPLLQEKFITGFIEHKTLLTAGIGESFLAEHIIDWEKNLPANLKLAYLPKFGMIRLRLSGYGNNKEELHNSIQTEFEKLKHLVKKYLVVDEDVPIELAIAQLLQKHSKTVVLAESCTGGLIASAFTNHAGASNIFNGGVVCYSNFSKNKILQVPNEILNTVGAVSKETVELLAANVLQLLNSDYAIAVSGIMGPDGGTQEKPVGFVWIAVANKKEIRTKSFQFRYDRERNMQHTMVTALNMLRELIVNDCEQ